MTNDETMSADMQAHQATYRNFVKGSVALVLACAFVLIALINFKYGNALIFLAGFGGIILGIAAIAIDARAEHPKWLLSIGLLVVYVLITLLNIT